MFDMIVLSFWTDSTRVATFTLNHEQRNRYFNFSPGVKGMWHTLRHWEYISERAGDDDGKTSWTTEEVKLRQYLKVITFHYEQVAYFLDRLRNITEADGSLLDHSMILYGSPLCRRTSACLQAVARHDSRESRRETEYRSTPFSSRSPTGRSLPEHDGRHGGTNETLRRNRKSTGHLILATCLINPGSHSTVSTCGSMPYIPRSTFFMTASFTKKDTTYEFSLKASARSVSALLDARILAFSDALRLGFWLPFKLVIGPQLHSSQADNLLHMSGKMRNAVRDRSQPGSLKSLNHP